MRVLVELTDEERKIIDLYRKCSSVDFYLHDPYEMENAKRFVNIIGDHEVYELPERGGIKTLSVVSRMGKVKAAAFVEDTKKD